MPIAKRHAPLLFLVIMVFFMVLAMTAALCFINGATWATFWHVWPRQFLIAYPVALPVAYVSRIVANRMVARWTA